MEDNIFDKVHEVDLKQTMETSYIDCSPMKPHRLWLTS